MNKKPGGDNHLLYVLDSDESVLAALQSLLTTAGYRVECFTAAKALLDKTPRDNPACIITEWALPDMAGHQLLDAIKAQIPGAAVIFLTARNELSEAVGVLRNGASDFIGKPYVDRTLVNRIRDAIKEKS